MKYFLTLQNNEDESKQYYSVLVGWVSVGSAVHVSVFLERPVALHALLSAILRDANYTVRIEQV